MSERRRTPEPRSARERAIPLGLSVLCLVAALLQRPGLSTADTKIDLHVDPWGFLSHAAAVWTNSGSLGEVQGGQYAGYLFPMGPFFALGHALGLGDWVVDRLWFGALMALAAWGTVRLLDALLPGRRGVAHLVAGALMAFNPYTVVYIDRTSVTLLGIAALPWLMLAVHRGLREPRRWWWPAALALLVTAAGAGVNAAVTAWVLVGPLALALYERLIGAVSWKDLRAFALRVLALGIPASAWWLGPVLIQTLYGIDFLKFTEQPGAIWASTSLTESLRLMGYWPSYLGVGHGSLRPFYDTSPDLLFSPVVVAATLVVPALCLAGYARGRRWAYGPFFLGLVLLGLLVMAAGFPPGTPLRQGVTFVYNHLSPVQFLRTTHKAGPLVALGLAALGGCGAAALLRRVGRPAAVALAVAGVALVAVAVLPLTRGRAVDAQLTYKRIPPAWQHVARDLDHDVDANHRAVVLPGQLLAYYRWGQTVDAVLPALTDRPVAIRQFVPRADLHSAELLIAVDALVQQERLVPGQLAPLLRLMGAQQVVTGSDDTPQSGAMPAADAARELAGQGLGPAVARYGATRSFSGSDGGFERPERLPEVRRHALEGSRGVVRVEPSGPATVVDGSAEGLADLAAFGQLPVDRPLRYAADAGPAALRRAARAGAELVVTDSNRRRVFVPATLRQNTGATLGPDDPISQDAAVLDPFPDAGQAAQTVALPSGVRYVRAPFSPEFPQLPEHRPAAAFDGSARTEWLGDTHLDAARRWVEVGFRAPRDVPYVDVLPAGGRATTVAAVEVAGRRHPVHPGWNRVPLGLRHASSLRLLLRSTTSAPDLRLGNGLAEVRIPGLRIRERLRPPTLVDDALRGRPLGRSGLTYLFSRTTGDRPFRRDRGRRAVHNAAPTAFEDPEARGTRDATDAEADIARVFRPPVARTYRVDAWTSLSPDAPDSAVDRVEGAAGATRFDSSGRFQGLARFRASAAFDGRASTAWVADRLGVGVPFLAWRTPSPTTVSVVRLRRARVPAARPTRVRLRTERGASPVLPVGPRGLVRLPRPLAGRSFRLEVLGTTRAPAGRGEAAATVGIAEVTGPGVPRAAPARGGALSRACGAATVRTGGRSLPLRLAGAVSDLQAGRPVPATACGPPLRLGARTQELRTREGVVRVDHLRLRSPAPEGPPAVRGGGAVLDPGRTGRGRHEDVRVRVDGPSWLVLGESFNRGWRATCDGRDLGAPRVVDGYANGWRVGRGCRSVAMTFAPQGTARLGYVISAIACPLLLLLLLLAPRGRGVAAAADPPPGPGAPRAGPLPAALAGGLAAGAASGFLFGLRTGPAAFVFVALVLWRGVGWRPLLAGAVGLLGVVVPAVYLLAGPKDLGGYNSDYAQALVGAHWVGVAAFVALAVVLARTAPLSRASGRGGGPTPAPPGAGP